MKTCRIDYSFDGCHGHVEVQAKTSMDALLAWMQTLPESCQVKALVTVLAS